MGEPRGSKRNILRWVASFIVATAVAVGLALGYPRDFQTCLPDAEPRPNRRNILRWLISLIVATTIAVGLVVAYWYDIHTRLPDEALPLGVALFAAATVVAIVSLVAMLFPRAPIEDRMFEGIFGHALVAVAALIVAGGLYEQLKTEHRSATICTVFGKDEGIPDKGVPYLLYVRDGVGSAIQGKPLLEKEIRMQPDNTKVRPDNTEVNYCAKVRYAAKYGFQFKLFVLYKAVPPEEQRKTFRAAICKRFQPGPDEYRHSDKPVKNIRPQEDDYCEQWPDPLPPDYKDQWRVWVLLKKFTYVQDAHTVVNEDGKQLWDAYWNNFYFPCSLKDTCPRD